MYAWVQGELQVDDTFMLKTFATAKELGAIAMVRTLRFKVKGLGGSGFR